MIQDFWHKKDLLGMYRKISSQMELALIITTRIQTVIKNYQIDLMRTRAIPRPYPRPSPSIFRHTTRTRRVHTTKCNNRTNKLIKKGLTTFSMINREHTISIIMAKFIKDTQISNNISNLLSHKTIPWWNRSKLIIGPAKKMQKTNWIIQTSPCKTTNMCLILPLSIDLFFSSLSRVSL